jgi:hypothetical protein
MMAGDMMSSSRGAEAHRIYQEPVSRLLDYGVGDMAGRGPAERAWSNYATDLGLTPKHIPELIRLACDATLHTAEGESRAVWAPTHAWRALGQLRALEAVAPLLNLLKTLDDDDWIASELPHVIGLIGPGAISPVTDFLADRSLGQPSLMTAIKCLEEIAKRHPASRDECVGILAHRLDGGADNAPTVNGFLISALIDLGAVETLDIIRHAFDKQVVDLSVAGDVEDVELELGVRTRRSTPRPVYHPFFGQPLSGLMGGGSDATASTNIEASAGPRKVGRNDPCPCGSGKKYKKCCLQ